MPRKPQLPRTDLIVQGLSDYQPMQGKDDLQAPTVFVDDFTGELREMKPEAEVKPQAKPTLPTHAVKPKSKHEAKLRAIADRQRSLELAMKLIRPEPEAPKPKHNQVITESGLVITVPTNPNAIKRRF